MDVTGLDAARSTRSPWRSSHNALRSVADETFIALMKSAYSTNIKERRDHSTAIMDTSRTAGSAGGR